MGIVTPAMERKRKEAAQRKASAKKKRGHMTNERLRQAVKENKENYGSEDFEETSDKMSDYFIKGVDIDVIIPISGSMYLDHLKNCLLSLKRQTLSFDSIGITISCLLHEDIALERLAQICKRYNATLVFTKPKNESFNRGYALNVGARQGSRSLITTLDADVYLHKSTLAKAARVCQSAVMSVIPVIRKDLGPEAPVWSSGKLDNDDFWNKFSEGCPYARAGFGNAVYQRRAFEDIGGHDERYFGWGGIDTDIYYRCLKKGKVVDLGEIGVPKALHQKHKEPPSKSNASYTERNRKILAESQSIKRNGNRWGRVFVR